MLDLLSVDPTHQNAGVGSLLTQWGTELADKMRCDVSISTERLEIVGAELINVPTDRHRGRHECRPVFQKTWVSGTRKSGIQHSREVR